MYLQSRSSIVIYGGAKYARRLIDYMTITKEEEKIHTMVVTRKTTADYVYKGITLQNALPFLEQNRGASVLIAASAAYRNEIMQIVSKYTQDYYHIMDELFFDMGRKLNIPYKGVNFIVGGFMKCGTTSLYKVLSEVDEIFLSDIKESQFFSWCDKVENPKKRLMEKYLNNIREGQTVGMVDPSFMYYAEGVYDYFGDDVKLIFLVRNPTEALFSKFKMDNRNGDADLGQFYQKTGTFYIEMFDEYFRKDHSREIYKYAQWIEKFRKYYAKEQIKIIFFEELIKSPQTVIQDMLGFAEVSCKYLHRDFPSANEGNFVMADAAGYKLAKLRYQLKHEIRYADYEDEQKRNVQRNKYIEITKEYNNVNKIFGLKMTDEQRNMVEKYYFDSVRKLETMVDRDLSKLWF